ncbi:MAG: hypothetical protein ACI9FJ_000474, partial [Alteromonadaceae bacterium]
PMLSCIYFYSRLGFLKLYGYPSDCQVLVLRAPLGGFKSAFYAALNELDIK